jgi:regulator of protease activity HflC (stomatin/prohibitin superfamily)
MLASREPVELSKLLEGLAENHRLEVRNAGYRRAIEIIKSNAPEVERLASLLIEQRRTGVSGIVLGNNAAVLSKSVSNLLLFL